MSKKKSSSYDSNRWMVQSVDKPFKLFKIQNVFSNQQYVTNLKEELEKLEFFHNMNDMFSLHQTKNLTHLKNHPGFPMLNLFLQFLDYLKNILSREMDVVLEPVISVSSSKYCHEDFLLCHDDHSEDRYIAFIYYLNPIWKTDWGGSLDIFEHDNEYQPSSIVHSIYPEFNSLIFFQVGNSTYHQVAEVLTSDVARITINGWFHSKRALSIKPLLYHEKCINFMETHDKGALLYLQHFINKDFVNEMSKSLICSTLEDDDVIMLQEFLKPKIFNQISKELNSVNTKWRRKGPANRRRYDVVDENSLPSLTAAFLNFVRSKYMCSYLETITGRHLFRTINKKNVGLVHVEIQSWKGTYYSLLNDCDILSTEDTLEMWLFFNVQEISVTNTEEAEDNSIQPGNIYYCTKGSQLPECEIEPKNNSVCWVRRKRDQIMFVVYINAESSLQYQAMRISYKI